MKIKARLCAPICTKRQPIDISIESFEGSDGLRLTIGDTGVSFSVLSVRKLSQLLSHACEMEGLDDCSGDH
ncbi:hypothetical protein LCGC14_1335320 [marine sediment metagenome]|uniref:Uncharacterized protein n=1 Tax=marine sediment metagenome TaxID=412755 RepID=A0A0F9NHU2_9ZZZZ